MEEFRVYLLSSTRHRGIGGNPSTQTLNSSCKDPVRDLKGTVHTFHALRDFYPQKVRGIYLRSGLMVNNSCSIARMFKVLIMVRVHGVCGRGKLVAHTNYPQNRLNLRNKGNVGTPFCWRGVLSKTQLVDFPGGRRQTRSSVPIDNTSLISWEDW